jgi:hypothetical protein
VSSSLDFLIAGQQSEQHRLMDHHRPHHVGVRHSQLQGNRTPTRVPHQVGGSEPQPVDELDKIGDLDGAALRRPAAATMTSAS